LLSAFQLATIKAGGTMTSMAASNRAGNRAPTSLRQRPHSSDRRLTGSTSRLSLALLLGSAGACGGSIPAWATNFKVSNTGELYNVINGAGNGDTITFTSNITLSNPLPALTKNVTINGGNFTLSGANTYRGFLVTSGTVALNNLQIVNTLAQGGNGGNSYRDSNPRPSGPIQGGGGGGGAGLGSGLFVASGANVILSNVSFRGGSAIGGAGGIAKPSWLFLNQTGGGGGSMFGHGGNSDSCCPSGQGGAGGGGRGGGIPSVLDPMYPLPGGFGGGGGGASFAAYGYGSRGAAGGFGGGGGGGGGIQGNIRGTFGGAGGFGGGEGGSGEASGAFGQGGGGAGMGGAIFVQQGGALTLAGALNISGNMVAGGVGFRSGQGYGSGLFLQGNGVLALFADAAQTQTISDGIADQTGVAGAGGSWRLVKNGAGTTILTGTNAYSGGLTVTAGVLQGNSNSLLGNIAIRRAAVVFDQNFDGTYAGNLTGPGTLAKSGAGRLSITGVDEAGGGTIINGGTLAVNGKLTSNVSVNAGGTLAGSNNVVGNVAVNGGKIAPGNSIGTLTIDGSLTVNIGVFDMEIAPGGKSDKIILTGPNGALTLGVDTLNMIFGPGLYAPGTYTLMSASQGVSGHIDAATVQSLPDNFIPYAYTTSNEMLLTLTAALGDTVPLSRNQQAITGPLNTIYNATGVLPSNFAQLYGLSGSSLGNALSQTSGEAATGLRPSAVQMTNQFLSLMLNPFVDGRSGAAGIGAPPFAGFASEAAVPPSAMLAYAPDETLLTHKASYAAISPLTAWGAAYGGAGHINGDPWGVGSHSLTANAGGVVAGLDYLTSPNSVFGFALAGGGTNWSLASGLGGGDSTAFQAGLYGATHWGPAYLGGSLSFTNHWASTNRSVLGESLTAKFDAQSYGARVESGYRVATSFGAVTPYAAGQAQSFHAPDYAETGSFMNSFALGYRSDTSSDARGELGLRFESQALVSPGAMLAFQGRLAWAHDWSSNPSLAATFLDIPGASFAVSGATPSTNLALVAAGVELRLANGVSLLGKFDAELGDRSTLYAGTATLRYQF
jgi:autotransporter-associated beta strand protein